MHEEGILKVLLDIKQTLQEALEKHDERISKLEKRESWVSGAWWMLTGVLVTVLGFLKGMK